MILTTANIGFIVMRLMLLAGFEVAHTEGVAAPFALASVRTGVVAPASAADRRLARPRPTLFGSQILAVADPRQGLANLLEVATASANQTRRVDDAIGAILRQIAPT